MRGADWVFTSTSISTQALISGQLFSPACMKAAAGAATPTAIRVFTANRSDFTLPQPNPLGRGARGGTGRLD